MGTQAITIRAHFNGPPDSANGGYTCGLLAAHIDGPARVRLQVPPPLDTPLTIRRNDDGSVSMYDGDASVGTAWPTDLAPASPPAPSPAAAREASAGYPGHRRHQYPTCYVCGTARHDDGMCIFPGPVAGSDLHACLWTPRPEVLDGRGQVRPEFVWSALDCPGYFAALGQELPAALLGELSAGIFAPVPGEAPLVIYCWPMGREGRKARAGVAIADAAGQLLALSHSVWILPRPAGG